MGLDMYLYRFPKSKTREQINQESEELWMRGIEEWRKSWKKVYQIGYWRKVNFLHGWFVNTLAGGVDECQDIIVKRENMASLKSLVDEACDIILSPATTFVPQKNVSTDEDKSWNPKYVADDSKGLISVKWNGNDIVGLDDETVYFIDDNSATELNSILPPEGGFFFGLVKYNYWYVYSMLTLRKQIDDFLAEWDDDKYTYIYQASW